LLRYVVALRCCVVGLFPKSQVHMELVVEVARRSSYFPSGWFLMARM